MVSSIQIMFGLVAGCFGFVRISSDPLLGGCALLVSGFLILSGIDRFCRSSR